MMPAVMAAMLPFRKCAHRIASASSGWVTWAGPWRGGLSRMPTGSPAPPAGRSSSMPSRSPGQKGGRHPLRFEASVASAIPIVETLAETLAADRINSLTGILNGTTNSILDAMTEGVSHADALADAQRRGLAEADPSADVDAHDPAAKLAILGMLGFGCRIDPPQIGRVGIRGLGHTQFVEGRQRGVVVKLIAAARLSNGTSVEAGDRVCRARQGRSGLSARKRRRG